MMIETTCPMCGKLESLLITENELKKAKKNHRLISKAINHKKQGHIFALYVDYDGNVRRRYCFDIFENHNSLASKNSFSDLETVFTKMFEAAKKSG